jgi:SAM-dependent methyltransferase
VPDPARLLAEIRRVLRPGGFCYFAAGNRLSLIEGHYGLPFLATLPRPLADRYLRLTRRGSHYYERHLSLWSLRRLVCGFEITDYTRAVLAAPERFAAGDVVPHGALRRGAVALAARLVYWACPTYLWILRHPR